MVSGDLEEVPQGEGHGPRRCVGDRVGHLAKANPGASFGLGVEPLVVEPDETGAAEKALVRALPGVLAGGRVEQREAVEPEAKTVRELVADAEGPAGAEVGMAGLVAGGPDHQAELHEEARSREPLQGERRAHRPVVGSAPRAERGGEAELLVPGGGGRGDEDDVAHLNVGVEGEVDVRTGPHRAVHELSVCGLGAAVVRVRLRHGGGGHHQDGQGSDQRRQGLHLFFLHFLMSAGPTHVDISKGD